MVKQILYPFIAAQVACDMAVARGRDQLKLALHQVLVDTLTDAKEINELKAEIAVLRSEVSDIRYSRAASSSPTRTR